MNESEVIAKLKKLFADIFPGNYYPGDRAGNPAIFSTFAGANTISVEKC